MNIYDLTSITNVFFCGGANTDNEETLLNRLQDGMTNGIDVSMHPKEIERQQRIGKRRASRGRPFSFSPSSSYKSRGNGKYDRSVIFVSGGFGFGTKDDSFFQEILEKVNELCKGNGSHVMFVRGSSDDPSYFTEHKFDFSNVKLLEDYSVVKLNGFDCLCVGGSIPIDRKWRMEQKERLGRALYFENCNTKLDKELISETLEKNNVTCVITSDAPTFVSPYTDSSNDSKWVENDKSIIRDITEQRMVMDAIYGEMLCLNKKPLIWCSYAKCDDTSVVNRIKFVTSASAHAIFDIQEFAIEEFGTMLNGERAMSAKSSKRLKKASVDDGRTIGYAHPAGVNLGHPVEAIHVPNNDPEPRAPRWYEAALNNHPADATIEVQMNEDEAQNRTIVNLDELRAALVNDRDLNQHDIDQINEFVRRYGGQNMTATVDGNGVVNIDPLGAVGNIADMRLEPGDIAGHPANRIVNE